MAHGYRRRSYDVYLRDPSSTDAAYGNKKVRAPELFPTDVQIPCCLWDGLNYVQSNGAHIQCYLRDPDGTDDGQLI